MIKELQVFERHLSVFQSIFVPISRGNKSIWQMLSEVTQALQDEIMEEPGKSFTLTEEESSQSIYPGYITLTETARHTSDFWRLLEFLGQSFHYLPENASCLSDHEFIEIISRGRNAIDLLTKTFFIARTYFHRRPETESIQQTFAILDDFFKPGYILLGELMPSEYPVVSLSRLKDDLYFLKESVLKKDQGAIRQMYRNENGALTLFQNGAFHVMIDAQAPGAKEINGRNGKLAHEFYWAMSHQNIMNNAGSHDYGTIQTYTLPAGAPLERVLDGLCEIGFLDEQETPLLYQLFTGKGGKNEQKIRENRSCERSEKGIF